jgi:hypothetical protein
MIAVRKSQPRRSPAAASAIGVSACATITLAALYCIWWAKLSPADWFMGAFYDLGFNLDRPVIYDLAVKFTLRIFVGGLYITGLLGIIIWRIGEHDAATPQPCRRERETRTQRLLDEAYDHCFILTVYSFFATLFAILLPLYWKPLDYLWWTFYLWLAS